MYAELHAASGFSFLRGSSLPEELVERAAQLGYETLALVDRDGLAGAPRFFQAARKAGIRPLVGAELTLKGGGALPLLAANRTGYRKLCRLITDMKADVPKGEGALDLHDLTQENTDGLVALVGVDTLGHTPDEQRLKDLRTIFQGDRLVIDIQRHRRRANEMANQALDQLAQAHGITAVATNGVRHAKPKGRALLDVLTCIREKKTLVTAGRLLADNAERHLKSPKKMAALFADRPDLLRNTEALAERLEFTLD